MNNPYTWEIDDYNPYEGTYNASCFYDPALGTQVDIPVVLPGYGQNGNLYVAPGGGGPDPAVQFIDIDITPHSASLDEVGGRMYPNITTHGFDFSPGRRRFQTDVSAHG